MEGDSRKLFGELTAQVDAQDDLIKASTARISGQEERMELMEDMITALAYTLKELDESVQLRAPLRSPEEQEAATGHGGSSLDRLVGQGMPTTAAATAVTDIGPVYGSAFGYLWKQNTGRGIGTQWKKRWFVLQPGGSCLYFKTMAESTAGPGAEKTLLSLQGYTAMAATDTGKPFGFRLVCPGQRTYTLAPEVETEENRTKWLDAFRDGIMAQTSSNKSFKRTASITSLAPLSPAGPDATGAAAAPALSDVQDLATGQALLDTCSLSGWMELRKPDGIWSRQFFVVVEKELVQVSGEDAAAIVQRIPLPGSVIDILWEDPPDDKERAFAVVKGDDTLITINSDTDDQMGEWVPVLTNLAQSN